MSLNYLVQSKLMSAMESSRSDARGGSDGGKGEVEYGADADADSDGDDSYSSG